jgi:hypothetical protein
VDTPGLAQNNAAEVKLRAERKAGELLRELERGQGKRTDMQLHSSLEQSSPYRQVLTENSIAPTTAHRWQTVARHSSLEQRRANTGPCSPHPTSHPRPRIDGYPR